MKLGDIHWQSWQTLVCHYYQCQACCVVDSDDDRMRVGRPCPQCGVPSPAALLHFGMPAAHLVNSIQDLHFVRRAEITLNDEDFGKRPYKFDTDTRQISAILFCTIFDVLMTQLTNAIMRAMKLPHSISDRLLSDYKFSSQKRDRLYPVLMGEKFKESLATIADQSGQDYSSNFDFVSNLAQKRNAFIHRGNAWSFTSAELEQIPDELMPLFRAFVALHNYQRAVHNIG